ncbi:MAG: GAF domain-containing protein [Ilumatobacteraceae bacterium]
MARTISDANLLNSIAEFLGFDAVVLVVAGDDPPKVWASWPMDRTGAIFDDSTEVGRNRLLIAAGGNGGNVASATVEIDTGLAVTVHGSLIAPHRVSLESIGRALETLVWLIGSQLGADIARRRVQEVTDRMEGLVDLILTLGQGLNLDAVLIQIVELARNVLGARYAALGVLDASGTGLDKFVTAGLSPEEKAAIGELPEGRGLLGAIIRDPHILRLEHMKDDPRSVGFPPHHPPMDSFLGVPIVIHGEIFGNLYLTDKEDGQFTTEDEQIVQSFALQAAAAVDNTRRYEVERQRANMLEIVQEIEHAIHATPGIQQALDVLCARLGEKLGVDRVKTDTHVNSEHDVAFGSEWHRPHLQPLGPVPEFMARPAARLAEELWRTVRHRVMDDYLAPQVHTEGSQVFLRYSNARAAIIVPIMLGERALGSIYVIMADQPRHWTETEVHIVETIAGFVGRIIVEAQDQFRQRKYIERLERLERQQSNFVTTVSHELRTPLTSITGYLELLQDGVGGELMEEQQQMLEVMDRNTDRLRRLIENILLLNQSESGGLKVDITGVSIGELITDMLQEVSPTTKSRDIELDIGACPEEAVIHGDKEQMHKAIVNIVANAIKFSHPGGEVIIRCTLDQVTRRVILTCQDRGIGVPLDDQRQLFTPFYRGSNATNQQIPGTGLGLTIVKQIVEDHGGQVRLASVEGEGTTVVIDLPLSTQAPL